MIHMRVRNQDMADGFAPHRVQHGRKMRLVVGARINDRNVSAAHDKGVRSPEGERAGIIAGYPSDKR